MTDQAVKKEIEFTDCEEWLREFSGLVSFDEIDESERSYACEKFLDRLHTRLLNSGFAPTRARGQRSTCHGWNGANTFRHQDGPCGTFDDLTSSEKKSISISIDKAEEDMRQAFGLGDDR